MTAQRTKVYELVLFNDIFVQLSVTFDIQTDLQNETPLTLEANSEAYSEPCQISTIEVFAQIVNSF